MTEQEELKLLRRVFELQEENEAQEKKIRQQERIIEWLNPETHLPEEFMQYLKGRNIKRVPDTNQWDEPGRSWSLSYLLSEWRKTYKP